MIKKQEQVISRMIKTLRSMYEAARADRISQANHSSIRSIVVNSLIILISIVLFLTHWLWMKGLSKTIAAG
jgi:type VI protein secretion system component VasF